MKVSDEFTVPLCRLHHREVHRAGDEKSWWADLKIDPIAVASRLWQESHATAPVQRTRRIDRQVSQSQPGETAAEVNGSCPEPETRVDSGQANQSTLNKE